jgi:hypothetical protein
MKKNVTWCDRSMFQGPHYGLVTTPKLFKKELRKMGVDDSLEFTSGSSDATCYEFESRGKTSFIVTIKGWKEKDPIEVAALIVHEATHIKQHIMRIIGEKTPSDEFEAYMMQNIYANLMQRFTEQTQ